MAGTLWKKHDKCSIHEETTGRIYIITFLNMKILNLYAWIGWNRKLWWNEHDITAVEYNEDIANVYKAFYPNDTVIVWDAHQYLLDHYKEFDFIWSSPPCPSHSDIRRCWVHAWQYNALYPDMTLYQQIILLKHFAKWTWCVENVKPYYKPLIEPNHILQRHYFWNNFPVKEFTEIDTRKHNDIKWYSVVYWVDLSPFQVKEKRKLLRNMVNPNLWKHILESVNINDIWF